MGWTVSSDLDTLRQSPRSTDGRFSATPGTCRTTSMLGHWYVFKKTTSLQVIQMGRYDKLIKQICVWELDRKIICTSKMGGRSSSSFIKNTRSQTNKMHSEVYCLEAQFKSEFNASEMPAAPAKIEPLQTQSVADGVLIKISLLWVSGVFCCLGLESWFDWGDHTFGCQPPSVSLQGAAGDETDASSSSSLRDNWGDPWMSMQR